MIMSGTIYAAIETKFLGHTSTKPARVRAECQGEWASIPYNSDLTPLQNACAGATFLIRSVYGWTPETWSVGHRGTDHYVFTTLSSPQVRLG